MQITLLSEPRKKGLLAGKTMAARGHVNGRGPFCDSKIKKSIPLADGQWDSAKRVVFTSITLFSGV